MRNTSTNADRATAEDEGAVFRYDGPATGGPPYEGTEIEGVSGSRLGDSIAIGDVDGDGMLDLATGAPLGDDGGLTNQGEVVVCRDASTNGDCPWRLRAGVAGAQLGEEVEVGDVDGDGFGDVVAGAPFWSGDFLEEGRVVVFRGSASGPSLAPDFVLALGGSNAQLGFGLDVVDVNRDGFADILAGGNTARDGAIDEAGVVGLWLGSPIGPTSTPAWLQYGAEPFERLHRVSHAGDVDGDGAPDIAFGSTTWNSSTGKVSVFHGPPIAGPRLVPGIPSVDDARVTLDGTFVDPASGPKRCTIDFGEGAPLMIEPCDAIAGEHDYDGAFQPIRVTVENGYGVRGAACVLAR